VSVFQRRKSAVTVFLLLVFLSFSGCGGGSSSPSSPTEAVCTGSTPPTSETPSANQMVVYQSTCQGSVNTPVVTLTICVPHTNTCEDVPNILVDLGSTGLRLSHTLSISSQLPQESGDSGPITECYAFVSGYNYGPVVTATITLGNEAVTVPVQISDSTLPAPSSCTTTGPSAPFEPAINGILGLLFPQDDTLDGLYYEGGAGPTTVSTSLVVQNPVFLMSSPENNGVLLSGFGTVSQTKGAPSVSGLLTFGTGSASSLTQLETNNSAEISASYKGNSNLLAAFFDSGSNGLFIDNSSIRSCSASSGLSGFFCGNAPSQSAILTGTNSSSVTLNFSIESAQTLLATGNQDFSTLGGLFSGYFDAGFPAFLYGYTIGVGWGPNVNTTDEGYFLYGN
jgi:hypothetical protein